MKFIDSQEFKDEFKSLSVSMKRIVEETLKSRTYREKYNQRSDVKIKRSNYMKKRNQLIKQLMNDHRSK